MNKIYGVSTGDSGDYGIGDIFEGVTYDSTESTLDGESVYYIFKIVDNKIITLS